MKKLSSLFLIALGCLTIMSCNKEIEDINSSVNETAKSSISFKAVADAPTKATLTDDYEVNKVFRGAWEPTDIITVDYGSSVYADAQWSAATKSFSGNDIIEGENLLAYFPNTEDGLFDFSGENRKQNGNAYNSKFDLMYSDSFELSEDGEEVTVSMHRSTAIQYFHLTASDIAEWANLKVKSATLEVTGSDAAIAAETVYFVETGDFDFENGQNSISITFEEGTAPTASDVQLWFNVLPCTVDSMTITVELENGYTWTKTNDFGGDGYEFKAGKLGYVKGAPSYKKPVEEATMTGGTNASEATVNKKFAIKVGTSKNTGDMTITVGAGATSLSFYAAAWKGASEETLTISPAEKASSSSVTLSADDGIANNSPFTLVQEESIFKHTIGLNNITAETTFTLTANVRFVVWDATYSFGDTPTPPTPAEYTITIADDIVGGGITASAAKAKSGAEISLTATPNSGYEFDSWNVTNASTSEVINVVDNKFTMPAADVNVSAVFNEKPIPTFASLEELAAADLASGTEVNVSFENVPIKEIYVTNNGYRNGIYFDIQKGENDIELYFQNVPAAWVEGGTVSGTLTKCPWKLYNNTWELAPASGWSWNNLEYTAPVVLAAPVFTTQPIDATYVLNESSKNLTVVASGNPSPTYQWYSNTTNSNENGTVLTGETSTSYKPSTNAVGTFYYYCVATNSEGSEASSVATIKVTTASLPFSFDGGRDDIAKTDGMSHSGLGTDYTSSPKLKFDDKNDNVIISFNEAAKKVTYTIKGNSTAGTYSFDVMESANGVDYTTVHSHTSITDTKTYTDNLTPSSRFVKFVYTTKASGNVALGNICISNKATYTLTISSTTNGSIAATVDGKSVVSGAQIEEGKSVTIKATPATNYEFDAWDVTGATVGTTATETFTINGNVTVGATFKEKQGEKTFSTTYGYGLSDWSLTNYTKQSDYYQVPSGTDPSVATIAGIFEGKTITSDVVVTLNVATYGSGTDPSASTFSIYKETACTNSVYATQGGTLPTSSKYTNVTYTVTKANAASFENDLAIKITKPGKTIRLKSIKVEFKYTNK